MNNFSISFIMFIFFIKFCVGKSLVSYPRHDVTHGKYLDWRSKNQNLPTKNNFNVFQVPQNTSGRTRCTFNSLKITMQNYRVRKWNKNTLTYKFRNYPLNGMDRYEVDREIERALNLWAEQTNLFFKLVKNGNADIIIEFVPYYKGDGKGNTVAFAYFPPNGDAYFDDEDWTSNSPYGVNLFQTAVHEFGHSLGLDHSNNPNAVMYGLLQEYSPYFRLHDEDIQRIQKLYGSKKSTTTTTTSKPLITSTKNPKIPETSSKTNLCAGNFDSVLQFESNAFYVIKGNQCWLFENGKLKNGYPKLLIDEWPYNFHYFQRNNTYWKILIGDLKISQKISSFVMNGYLHIFQGNQFWKINIQNNEVIIQSTISKFWEGVPQNIDGAYFVENFIYFFKNEYFYAYDNNYFNNEFYSAVKIPLSEWIGCKH